jgi:hypothetical protein
MFSFLKNHPFAVEAHFESSIVLTFAIEKQKLQHLIPPCLELDTFNDRYGFVAVALVQTNALRPKGFHRFMGHNFILIGYRIFVRYTNTKGRRLRGLYILKSETNKKIMEYLGNFFTSYKYTTTDISLQNTDNTAEIKSTQSGFRLNIKKVDENAMLPTQSPFNSWQEARRYAGPLPFTFSYQPKTNKVLIIEGVRENWVPRPLNVIDYNFEFLKTNDFKDAVLANAFIVEDINYSWKKGKLETWKN